MKAYIWLRQVGSQKKNLLDVSQEVGYKKDHKSLPLSECQPLVATEVVDYDYFDELWEADIEEGWYAHGDLHFDWETAWVIANYGSQRYLKHLVWCTSIIPRRLLKGRGENLTPELIRKFNIKVSLP